MTHYWGAKAIVERLGYKNPSSLYDLKRRVGAPCYIRADPRNPRRRMQYASEAMILAWELARSRLDTDRLDRLKEEKVRES